MAEVGAPTKYKEEYNEQAYKLCLLGATDAALADFFEVHVDTIYEWKNVHPEFSESVKKGKYAADANIANSLYERAKGCTVTRQTAIKLTSKKPMLDDEGKVIRGANIADERIEVVTLQEEVPPDTTAMIFWLKNRQPKEWRDKQEITTTVTNKSVDSLDDEDMLLAIQLSKKLNAPNA